MPVSPITTPVTVPSRNSQPVTVLKRGTSGPEVKQLQERLNALGFDCGEADGKFGKNTEAAVIAFQRAQGEGVLGSADGKVGRRTSAALQGQPQAQPAAPAPADGFDPGTPAPAQTLRRMKQSEVTPAITQKAIELRKQYARVSNYGLEIPFESGGKQYVARIEKHFHEPGGPLKPWGEHPGVSVLAVV